MKSRKAVRKSRKVVRKSRKAVRKSRKAVRKSRKKSRKSRKAVRKSRKKSRKSRKAVRKSRKSRKKSRKAVRKSRKKSRKKSRRKGKRKLKYRRVTFEDQNKFNIKMQQNWESDYQVILKSLGNLDVFQLEELHIVFKNFYDFMWRSRLIFKKDPEQESNLLYVGKKEKSFKAQCPVASLYRGDCHGMRFCWNTDIETRQNKFQDEINYMLEMIHKMFIKKKRQKNTLEQMGLAKNRIDALERHNNAYDQAAMGRLVNEFKKLGK